MEENNQEIINNTDTDTDKDNQYLFNFISSHFNDLIQVYLKERKEKKLGILQIIGNKKEKNVDVMYMMYNDMNDNIQKIIKEKEDKCLFLTFDNETPDNYFITEYKL